MLHLVAVTLSPGIPLLRLESSNCQAVSACNAWQNSRATCLQLSAALGGALQTLQDQLHVLEILDSGPAASWPGVGQVCVCVTPSD